MRPHDDLRLPRLRLQESRERVESLRHVRVAKVPGGDAPLEHRAVVALGVPDQPRVLLRKEILIPRDPAVALRVVRGALPHLDQLADHFVLAAGRHPDRRGVPVRLRVLAEVVETRVPIPRPPRCLRIDLVQVSEDRPHRRVQAVEVEPVKTDFLLGRHSAVVSAQPPHEVEHIGVAPHPGREAPEPRKSFGGVGVVRLAAHIAIDPIGVGPVRFHRDGGEALLPDQPLGDLGALPVELVRPVRRLSEQRPRRGIENVD